MLLSLPDIATPSANWHRIIEPLLSEASVEVWLYCPVTAEPMLSGNKWMKLQYHIKLIQQQQYRGLVTFGGPFSNHLAACAAAAKLNKFNATAYVRADNIDPDNPTLAYCQTQGMKLIAIDRQSYRQRQQPAFIELISKRHPGYLVIPEGGSSAMGMRGIAGLNLTDTPAGPADIIATASASGGTLAGIITAASQAGVKAKEIIGLAVVNDSSLADKVAGLLTTPEVTPLPWRIITTAAEHRYAKCPVQHIDFSCQFTRQHGIAIEPVYTGRALYKLYQMIAEGQFAPGSRISFFHTGGLQGLAGLYYRKLINLQQYRLLSGATVG
ncbi:MAG: cysteine desulfhydrase [Rheinheimera sp.]|uniref:1-aminocyclopropane-1-carboxylate deaminase/D-cysteine desulfhydrase n=2 Tax=unclassified Arsukibacterium TaxID=2635278 RepID=UPI000C5D685E|nr:pyridoxal-phosphate dependent enzyme [Arsukibacterium sp. UBA3189]MAA94981.1 cysteine desulfhydrase [Rheinheimera sp.]MBM35405.1 cysteine desulfhydrase [Rheinheimera sp.]HAW94501.1 cysteine desulfhydrase [Candidatus Azambacteria bacterium]|tara:strand:+ start:35157 stop:36134 length:978 start_codon:yes stop_codon:yes gene_type:complete